MKVKLPIFTYSISSFWRIGLIIMLVWLIYGQVFTHELTVYDDSLYISANSYVLDGVTWEGVKWAFTNFDAANWHPLTWLSHMLDCHLWGVNGGYHIGENVVWHSLNAVLVYLFAARLFGGRGRAFFVALIFAIHPQNIEAVAWASQRKSLLNVFFSLLALIAYLRYVRSGRFVDYGAMLIAFMISLTAKSMSVTLPVLMCLLDIWPLQRVVFFSESVSDGSRFLFERGVVRRMLLLIGEKSPLFVISAWIGYITILAQDATGAVVSTDALPLWVRVVNAILAYVAYLKNAVYPSDLSVFYLGETMFPLRGIVVGSAVVLLLTIFAIISIYRRPSLAIGWAWFVITLLPVIGLLQVGMQARADRYFYFPSIGLLIMIAGLFPIPRLPVRSSMLLIYGIGGVWALSLAVYSFGQVKIWKTSTLLMNNAWEKGGHYSGTLLNLSCSYYVKHRLGEGLAISSRGVVEFPWDTNFRQNRAAILLALNRPAEAMEDLQQVKAAGKYSFEVYLMLADCYHRLGDDRRASESLKICQILLPERRQWRMGYEIWRRRLLSSELTIDTLYTPLQ